MGTLIPKVANIAGLLKNMTLETGYMALAVKKQKGASEYSTQDIVEVCEELVRATHGLYQKESREINLHNSSPMTTNELLIPVIVTSAELFLADIDWSKKLDLLHNGELSDEVRFRKTSRLVFEYPIPHQLQLPFDTGLGLRQQDRMNRRHILVVNSDNLEDFLHKLHENFNIT